MRARWQLNPNDHLKMAIPEVFVTVGTTQFDKLISSVLEEKCINVLAKKGCKTLVMQIGQSKITPPTEKNGIQIISFTLKPSISDNISKADLIISHAGAGSCLGVLSANKPLIVVINEDLMDNHQEELADKLMEKKYLFKSDCSNLMETLMSMQLNSLAPFEPGNPKVYANYIDDVMGFSS